ncbi:MAG TPA: hypothetical protein VGM53_30510 [Streptosporangiaceae bacterium]|jgi:hypothetical protein
MGDPELVARAQRAAVRLERSWDRWRRLHGLAAEQAQPVSSYVGYSLAEPWGRPRVVFGVGAEEAEKLSDLLEQDTGEDPRFSQGMLWEAEKPHRAAAGEYGVNGTQPAEPVIPEARQGEPQPGSQAAGQATEEVSGQRNEEAGGGWEAPGRPGLPAQPSGMPSLHPAPPADGAGPDRGISADLAGWTASELPGQASAGLALAAAPGLGLSSSYGSAGLQVGLPA